MNIKIFIPVLLSLAGAFNGMAAVITDSIPVDEIVVHAKSTSRIHRISLYPDVKKKVLFFHVKGLNGRAYQLYVFDMQGRMIRQREIRNKQTTFIKDMEKGIYLFEVFSDDARISNGQIAVK